MRAAALPFALLAGLAATAAGADPMPDAAEAAALRMPLVPVEDDAVSLPPEPDTIDRAAREAAGIWAAVRDAAGTAAEDAGTALAPLVEEARRAGTDAAEAALPALSAAGDRALREGEALAAAFHEKTAELRAHPVVEAAADMGILLRAVEAVGVTLLVGGLAWRKLRGA